MQMYIKNLVELALRSLGVRALGDTLDADQASEAIMLLNQIRAERSIIPTKNWHLYDKTYTATANTRQITLGGPTSNITVRPSTIDEIIIINGPVDASNNNWNIQIKPYQEYRKLMVQNIYALPNEAYLDNEYPTQSVWLYPGMANGYSIRIIGKSYFTDYESLTDEFADPPETFEILRLSLALRLAPLYGVTDIMDLVKQMSSADKHYQAMLFNRSIAPMMNAAAGSSDSGFNFFSGLQR